jgi:hypothetical protein
MHHHYEAHAVNVAKDNNRRLQQDSDEIQAYRLDEMRS